MAAAHHTVLLCDSGEAVAFGNKRFGQCVLPRAPEGTRFVAAAVGESYSILLTEDGQVLGCGRFEGDIFYTHGMTNPTLAIPAPPAGVKYISMAAGPRHAVLLQDDGEAVGIGSNAFGQCTIPSLPAGVRYTKVAAGQNHTVLLCGDGNVVACGSNAALCEVPPLVDGLFYVDVEAGNDVTVLLRNDGEVVILKQRADFARFLPALPEGTKYIAAGIGESHVALLRDDGVVVACSDKGRVTVPRLPSGRSYVSLSTGSLHTVLLRDDGEVVAFGQGRHGQCNVPSLPANTAYVAAVAGTHHTVLLRDDGEAVTFGSVGKAPCLKTSQRYVAPTSDFNETVLTIHLVEGNDDIIDVECCTLSGDQISTSQKRTDTVSDLKSTIATRLAVSTWTLKVVLSSGSLLTGGDDMKSLGELLEEY